MQAVIDWMTNNWPAMVPLVFMLLGLVLHISVESPKWTALKDAILAIGVDLPKLYNAIKALFAPTPPSSGSGDAPGNVTPIKGGRKDADTMNRSSLQGEALAHSEERSNWAALGILWAVVAVAWFTVSGCSASLSGLNAYIATAQGYVQTAESFANGVVAAATIAFNDVLPMLPPADQATAKNAWTKAQTTFVSAENVLNDVLAAGGAATEPTPDLVTAVADVVDAVNQIVAVVNMYSANTGAALKGAPPHPALVSARAEAAKMTARWGSPMARAKLAGAQ